ncbi:MAG: RNA polymerase sigma factor [Acidimicrobiia bacterium]
MGEADDAEVYRKHADELMRFASALVGPSGAEDLLATSVLRALSAASWGSAENKRAYLYRVVFNEAMRSRRDARRRMAREVRAATSESFESVVADRDLIAALLKLSVRQRAVVFLTYWGDLPPSEVAITLSTSQRTVERELAAAKRRLEEVLT